MAEHDANDSDVAGEREGGGHVLNVRYSAPWLLLTIIDLLCFTCVQLCDAARTVACFSHARASTQ